MRRSVPNGWQEYELKDFLKFTPREVGKPKEKYLALGIRSHCKGTFVRKVENPDKVMMDSLYEVKKDDLIVNITFAWEGAVALVKKSDEGALVSHRFPTYIFNRKVVIPEFFKYLIPSRKFIYNLKLISPGGAGRNRVLDKKDFLHLRFAMPPIQEQKKIAEILSSWDKAIETLSRLIDVKAKFKRVLMQKLLIGEFKLNGHPNGEWKSVRIAECCLNLDNKRKPLNEQERNTMKGQAHFPYYGANGIVDYINNFIFDEDLILIAEDGGHFEEWANRPIAYLISGKSWVNNHAHVLKAKGEYSQLFIFYALEHKNILRYLNGGTRAKLNKGELNDIEILIPKARSEQNRIAAIFCGVDKNINTLKSLRELITVQKKALMQKLLTGKIRVKV